MWRFVFVFVSPRVDRLASKRSASVVAARIRNRPFAHPTSIRSGRSRSSYTSDHTGERAAVRWCSAMGLVSFFMRRCTLVFFRVVSTLSDASAAAAVRSEASAAPRAVVPAAGRDSAFPKPTACRLQYPSQPSAARDAQNRRRLAMYCAHCPLTRDASASAFSARFSDWYKASHSASAAMCARELFSPRSRSNASSRRRSSSRSAVSPASPPGGSETPIPGTSPRGEVMSEVDCSRKPKHETRRVVKNSKRECARRQSPSRLGVRGARWRRARRRGGHGALAPCSAR